MPDTPESDQSDDTSTDDRTESAGIVIDDAEAGFLKDRDPADYPSVLRITSTPEEEHRREALDRLERWEAGEDIPHVINFQNPSDLRSLLTDRRVEMLRSIMADRPSSIRQLVNRFERNVKSVHDDLQVLADYDIVHFKQADRAKRPSVPYETIEITLKISTPTQVDDPAPV